MKNIKQLMKERVELSDAYNRNLKQLAENEKYKDLEILRVELEGRNAYIFKQILEIDKKIAEQEMSSRYLANLVRINKVFEPIIKELR